MSLSYALGLKQARQGFVAKLSSGSTAVCDVFSCASWQVTRSSELFFHINYPAYSRSLCVYVYIV